MSQAQRSLLQERAKHAWNAIQEALKKAQGSPKIQKEYASLVRRTPSLIRSSGLGQTLAFLKAKKDKEHEWLYKHLSQWVLGQVKSPSDGDLLGWIINKADQKLYRYATQEALAYLRWLKRFAESELKPGERDESTQK
ncbi:MAG: type III-B CRISPR module-associated protein Cmr5 [Bacteroidia bacterium]|nr:type III-B CRISPR module-associated protein Cmr5 [Bacteroidia bacterium]